MMNVGIRPAALGTSDPGSTGQETKQDRAAIQTAPPSAQILISGGAIAPNAIVPSATLVRADAAEVRQIASEITPPKAPPPDPTREVVAPGGSDARTSEAGSAGKSYAQIPTEMMQEISRLREEAAQANAAGVPGRNDPTPMPARADAIGPSRVPFDAA